MVFVGDAGAVIIVVVVFAVVVAVAAAGLCPEVRLGRRGAAFTVCARVSVTSVEGVNCHKASQHTQMNTSRAALKEGIASTLK